MAQNLLFYTRLYSLVTASKSVEISYPDFFFELGLRRLEFLLCLRLVLGEGLDADLQVMDLALEIGVLLRQAVAQLHQFILAACQLVNLNLHPLQLLVQITHLRLRVLLKITNSSVL